MVIAGDLVPAGTTLLTPAVMYVVAILRSFKIIKL